WDVTERDGEAPDEDGAGRRHPWEVDDSDLVDVQWRLLISLSHLAALRLLPRADSCTSRLVALPEPIRLVARLDDMTVMRQSIEQRRGELWIAEHRRPLCEGQVCRDDHAGALVEL